MIQTVSDFLLQLQQQEGRVLADLEISHAPTIGDMYEGLSRDLLQRAIPTELGLRIVSGFIVDGLGGMSGQIDAMLVRGDGQQIPHTNDYIWHVRDVIAAFEIKKTLYGNALADAFVHLRGVKDLAGTYSQSLPADFPDLHLSKYAASAFAETTGLVAPEYDELSRLNIRDQMIFHTLLSSRSAQFS